MIGQKTDQHGDYKMTNL